MTHRQLFDRLDPARLAVILMLLAIVLVVGTESAQGQAGCSVKCGDLPGSCFLKVGTVDQYYKCTGQCLYGWRQKTGSPTAVCQGDGPDRVFGKTTGTTECLASAPNHGEGKGCGNPSSTDIITIECCNECFAGGS